MSGGWQKGKIGIVGIFLAGAVYSAQTTVEVFLLNDNQATKGIGSSVGTIVFEDGDKGLVIKPNLKGLPPGPHGFHIHEHGSCEGAEKDGKWQAGALAGGHFDPAQTEKHRGPHGKGHHGDLPVLNVDASGTAAEKLRAPHLIVLDLEGRSVVIHEKGDNYADTPEPLGGGGPRIACGVFQAGSAGGALLDQQHTIAYR